VRSFGCAWDDSSGSRYNFLFVILKVAKRNEESQRLIAVWDPSAALRMTFGCGLALPITQLND